MYSSTMSDHAMPSRVPSLSLKEQKLLPLSVAMLQGGSRAQSIRLSQDTLEHERMRPPTHKMDLCEQHGRFLKLETLLLTCLRCSGVPLALSDTSAAANVSRFG